MGGLLDVLYPVKPSSMMTSSASTACAMERTPKVPRAIVAALRFVKTEVLCVSWTVGCREVDGGRRVAGNPELVSAQAEL
jgi:hypothetical protein